jgi:hypothetical protein
MYKDKNLVNVDPESSVANGTGRILRIYSFDLVADAYGDIPYTEANRGYSEQIISFTMIRSKRFMRKCLKN